MSFRIGRFFFLALILVLAHWLTVSFNEISVHLLVRFVDIRNNIAIDMNWICSLCVYVYDIYTESIFVNSTVRAAHKKTLCVILTEREKERAKE